MNFKVPLCSVFLCVSCFFTRDPLSSKELTPSENIFSFKENDSEKKRLLEKAEEYVYKAACVSHTGSVAREGMKDSFSSLLTIESQPFYSSPMGGNSLDTCMAFEENTPQKKGGVSRAFITYTEHPSSSPFQNLFQHLLGDPQDLEREMNGNIKKKFFSKIKGALSAQFQIRIKLVMDTQEALRNHCSSAYDDLSSSLDNSLKLLQQNKRNLRKIKFPRFENLLPVGRTLSIVDQASERKFILTGHHWGGTLAQCIAFLTQQKAITFDSPSAEKLLEILFPMSFSLRDLPSLLNCTTNPHLFSSRSLFSQTLPYETAETLTQDFWTFHAPFYTDGSLTPQQKKLLLETPGFLEKLTQKPHPLTTAVGQVCFRRKLETLFGPDHKEAFKKFSFQTLSNYYFPLLNLSKRGHDFSQLFLGMGHLCHEFEGLSNAATGAALIWEASKQKNPIALCQYLLLLKAQKEENIGDPEAIRTLEKKLSKDKEKEKEKEGIEEERGLSEYYDSLIQLCLDHGVQGCIQYALDATHPASPFAQRCLVSLVLNKIISTDQYPSLHKAMKRARRYRAMDEMLDRFFLIADIKEESLASLPEPSLSDESTPDASASDDSAPDDSIPDTSLSEKRHLKKSQERLNIFSVLEEKNTDPIISCIAREINIKKQEMICDSPEKEDSFQITDAQKALLLEQAVLNYPDHVLFGNTYNLELMRKGIRRKYLEQKENIKKGRAMIIKKSKVVKDSLHLEFLIKSAVIAGSPGALSGTLLSLGVIGTGLSAIPLSIPLLYYYRHEILEWLSKTEAKD